MIYQDFPHMNEEEVENNLDNIDEYYGKALNKTISEYLLDPNYLKDFEEEYDVKITTYIPKVPIHVTKLKEGESKKNCVKRLANIKWNDFRQLIASANADKYARLYAESRYPNLSPANTKRDTYRHALWNALLCRYYWTTSSKKKKYDFAVKIAQANEDCANNKVGTLYMDYHNNNIGRNVWGDMTSYKKTIFGWITGLNEPYIFNLDIAIYNLIENKAVFIDMNAFPGDENEREEAAYWKIVKVDKKTPIFLSTQEGSDSYYETDY